MMTVISGIDFNYDYISETLSFHYVSMGEKWANSKRSKGIGHFENESVYPLCRTGRLLGVCPLLFASEF